MKIVVCVSTIHSVSAYSFRSVDVLLTLIKKKTFQTMSFSRKVKALLKFILGEIETFNSSNSKQPEITIKELKVIPNTWIILKDCGANRYYLVSLIEK